MYLGMGQMHIKLACGRYLSVSFCCFKVIDIFIYKGYQLETSYNFVQIFQSSAIISGCTGQQWPI